MFFLEPQSQRIARVTLLFPRFKENVVLASEKEPLKLVSKLKSRRLSRTLVLNVGHCIQSFQSIASAASFPELKHQHYSNLRSD